MPWIAIAGVVVGAAALANNIYQETNSDNRSAQGPQGWKSPVTGTGSLPGGTGVTGQPQSQETPEERAFYEMQTLAAENAATQLEQQTQIQANNSVTAVNWIEIAAIGAVGFLGYQIFKRKGYFK